MRGFRSLALNRVQADSVLLLTAAIWGGGFAAQRIAAQYLGPLVINGIRFLLAAACLLPLVQFRPKICRQVLPGVLLAGICLTVATNFQQLGLRYTTAGNAGFITSLYVILVPFFLAIFWHEIIHWYSYLAALIAVAGMFLINTGGVMSVSSGDLFELAGAVFWALHVIVIGITVRRMDVLSFSIGQFAFCGIVNLLFGLFFETIQVDRLVHAGWALIYAGIISGGIGYTLQALGQKYSPSSDAALILSLEAVFAALFGFLFLQEKATLTQIIGYALILVAIFFAQRMRPVETPLKDVQTSATSR